MRIRNNGFGFGNTEFRELLLLAFLLLATTNPLPAQSGCTDPLALNYNAAAVDNDGSCLYPFTDYPPQLVADLPEELKETSGLLWIDGKLYSHSDDGPTRLYQLDRQTGAILQSISVIGATNVDWEDLAVSEDYVYIGDFGNNSGNRTDLKIYRIEKTQLANNAVLAEEIQFSFADQTDFNHQNNAHNFDCEAFFFYGDSLHLFSKNWVNAGTRHYVLSALPGTHQAVVRDSFEVGGLITAADISAEGTIALLGRNDQESIFCWLLFDFPTSNFFKGNRRRILLGKETDLGQAEGLTFTSNGQVLLSSEEKNGFPARLYELPTGQWTGLPVATRELATLNFSIAPNPVAEFLTIQSTDFSSKPLEAKIYNAMGQLVWNQQISNSESTQNILVAFLPNGHYFLQLHQGNRQQSFAFQKL